MFRGRFIRKNEEAKASEAEAYINKVIINYIQASNIDVRNGYEISNVIPVYNFNKGCIIGYNAYLIVDGQLVGEIDIFYDKGKMFSLFFTDIDAQITDAYYSKFAFCFGGYNDNFIMCIENEKLFVLNDDKAEVADFAELKEINFEPGCFSIIAPQTVMTAEEVCNQIHPMSTDAQIMNKDISGIYHVQNVYESGYSNGKGICWAACIAMKVNYYKGTNCDAKTIYNYLKNNGYPYDGSVSAASLAYGYYNIPMHYSSYRTGNQVWTQIYNNNPVDLCIRGEIYKPTGIYVDDAYHQVLIKGMTVHSDGLTYKIDCPNLGNVSIFVEGSTESLMNGNVDCFEYTDRTTYKNGNYIVYNETYRFYW